MMLVIGLSGRIGAGKGTIAEYLKKKYGAKQLVYSDILSDVLRRLDVPVTRENLQALGKSLRSALGKEVLVKAMKADLKRAKGEMRLIDGVRYVNEAEMLRTFPHNVLIFVDAPLKVRYARAKRRNEKGEGRLTLSDFKEREKAATEREIEKVRKMADYLIENSGSLSDLHSQVDSLMHSR